MIYRRAACHGVAGIEVAEMGILRSLCAHLNMRRCPSLSAISAMVVVTGAVVVEAQPTADIEQAQVAAAATLWGKALLFLV
mmetsp:Transcript_39620/g.80012  ORF Transcript_39620/g.80012 Transcript_39620/m.80012 type:complete len:81 (+) Transcript_39620:383-625(+)